MQGPEERDDIKTKHLPDLNLFGYDLLERAQKYARIPLKQATTREKAFAKIRAQVEGTGLAEENYQ